MENNLNATENVKQNYPINDRFLQVIDHYGYTAYRLSKESDISQSQIAHIKNHRNKVSDNVIDELLKVFPEVNRDWLLIGKGNMLNSQEDNVNLYLKEAFSRLGKPQTEVIKDLGVSQQYVSALMSGKKTVGKEVANKLSELYGFDKGAILTGESAPTVEVLSPYLSRIEQVARHLGYSTVDDFARRNLEYKTKKQIQQLKNVSNTDIAPLVDITKKNDNINFRWLLTGEGDMLTTPQIKLSDLQIYEPDEIDPNDEYSVPLLPISAMGGSLTGFADSLDSRYRLQRLKVPVKGADWAMFVNGDSMAPECPNGSLVVVKRINELAFIEWGKIFVLDTCNGNILKRLKPTKDKRVVLCESINPEYPPFEVNLDDVFNIFVKVMCVSF